MAISEREDQWTQAVARRVAATIAKVFTEERNHLEMIPGKQPRMSDALIQNLQMLMAQIRNKRLKREAICARLRELANWFEKQGEESEEIIRQAQPAAAIGQPAAATAPAATAPAATAPAATAAAPLTAEQKKMVLTVLRARISGARRLAEDAMKQLDGGDYPASFYSVVGYRTALWTLLVEAKRHVPENDWTKAEVEFNDADSAMTWSSNSWNFGQKVREAASGLRIAFREYRQVENVIVADLMRLDLLGDEPTVAATPVSG